MPTTKTENPGFNHTIQDLRIPQRWRLEKMLGRGGQGEVWLATDLQLKQKVAVKILPADIDAATMARIRREVGIGRKLEHPHILRIHELVESEDAFAIVMQWMPGGSLAQAAKAEGIPVKRVIKIAEHMLEALAHLHDQGIVHRDVKPSNILIDEDDSVRLGDLGLIRPIETDEDVTRTNVAIGTVAYMSPEQIKAEEPSPAADLYSLGATLYNLVTHEMPFVCDSDLLVIAAHLNRRVENPRRLCPECPRWFARFIVRLMEKKPQDRWPDGQAALEAFRAQRGLLSPRVIRKTVVSVALSALLVVSGWLIAINMAEMPSDARAIGNDLAVFNEDGDELWRKEFEEPPTHTLVADVIGDSRPEVIVSLVGPGENDSTQSSIEVLTSSGSTIASFGIAHPRNKWNTRNITPGAELKRLMTLDIEGHGKPGLQWIARHPTWSPSALCSWGPRNNPQRRVLLSNSGHLQDAAAADLDGDGRPELITWGRNNPLGYQVIVSVIDVGSETNSPSPDQIRQWSALRAVGPENRLALSYTPIGDIEGALRFEETPTGFTLISESTRYEFDETGMPLGLLDTTIQSRIRPSIFWDDLATTLLEIESGAGHAKDLITHFNHRQAATLNSDAFHIATTFLTARSLARIDNPLLAADVFERGLDRHRQSPAFMIRYGEMLALAGNLDIARTQLREAILIPEIRGPSTLDAFTALLFVDCLSGDDDAFWDTIDLVESEHTATLGESMKTGAFTTYAFFRGDWDNPNLDGEESIVTMKWVEVLRAWADLERNGDLSRARKHFEKFKTNPEIETLSQLFETQLLLGEGKNDRALATSTNALNDLRQRSRESLTAYAWRQLATGMTGRCLKALGRNDEATVYFDQAQKNAPGAWFGHR